MEVNELAASLGLTCYTGEAGMKNIIRGGYVSDLLSDVMGRSKEGQVWITLQNHLNVVAVASLRELSAIILVNGIKPASEMVEKAVEENIAILGTGSATFGITGKIYNLLNS